MARRVAPLYDIEGNLPALDSVLDEVAREDVDETTARFEAARRGA